MAADTSTASTSTAGASTASMSTTAFLNSIGVNANPGDVQTTLSQLKYLGTTSIRTQLPASADAIAPYVTLAKAGITFDFLPAAGGSAPPMAQVQSVLDAIEKAAPGSIASVEGPNEPNIWPISYAGLSGTAAAVQYQTDLYNTVHSDPLLNGTASGSSPGAPAPAGVQVYNFPFGGVGPDTYAQAGDQTGSVDATNIHVYPDGLGNGAPAPEIINERDLAKVSAPTKPMVMTEFGYSTYAGGDIDQATQARFEIDGLLDQQRLGLSKTFLYDSVDSNTGTSGYEDNFGQFTTAGAPKAAGTALHNLSAILTDDSSVTPTDTSPAAPTDTSPAAPASTSPAAPANTSPAAPANTSPAAPVDGSWADFWNHGWAVFNDSSWADFLDHGWAVFEDSGLAGFKDHGCHAPANTSPAAPTNTSPAAPANPNPAAPTNTSPAAPANSGTGPLPSFQAPQISGLPAGAQTLTLEKSDGTIDLAIWDEGSSVNANVALSFAAPANVALYDPLQGSTSAGTNSVVPLSTAQNTNSFNFTLGTDPVVIAIHAA